MISFNQFSKQLHNWSLPSLSTSFPHSSSRSVTLATWSAGFSLLFHERFSNSVENVLICVCVCRAWYQEAINNIFSSKSCLWPISSLTPWVRQSRCKPLSVASSHSLISLTTLNCARMCEWACMLCVCVCVSACVLNSEVCVCARAFLWGRACALNKEGQDHENDKAMERHDNTKRGKNEVTII